MQIELYIDGKKKLFTTPFVPMLAKSPCQNAIFLEAEGSQTIKDRGFIPL